ncbi:type II toxin-antitoxin system PemK/MazF family toxin [Candidatus Stoquefichus massiliensis]|uniref:type II toxin-antitoxin system PemK/MazF family toxin n=1 Tax=Candidatus Stoquefichus massiliensis TaxID=1470350 RepID=UPI00047F4964|nr:type II toxin-antitoxin system PemK/MazF family toxin [Candidatus Stoquefichus massiliensis]
MHEKILRGDIYLANLGMAIGSEQGGIRPVIIIQNNVGNHFSPTTIVTPITTKLSKSSLPTHIILSKQSGITCKSIVMMEQIRVIDKSKLIRKVGCINHEEMQYLNKALLISIGLYV